MVLFIHFFLIFNLCLFEPDEGPGSGSKRWFYEVDNGEPLPIHEGVYVFAVV